MITYWSPERGDFTIREYVKLRGAPIADRFLPVAYESLSGNNALRGCAHIFSGADQLTLNGRSVVAELWDAIAARAPHWKLLNDPRRVLLRQPFLDAMAARKLNDFRVFESTSSDSSIRYPVFLRERDLHNGPLTALLDSPAAVRKALRALQLRGFRVDDLIQIEYQDTADEQGRYRKYSAFRVGDEIVRTHMMIATRWSVKSEANAQELETLLEEDAYVKGNAHESWLREVFELANIQWGRIDYGVKDGRPQAWEINMNPTIGRRLGKEPSTLAPELKTLREEGRVYAHTQLRAAFVKLDGYAPSEDIQVTLPVDLLRAVEREQSVASRRERAVQLLKRAYHSPIIGWPVRMVYGTVLRRR